MPFMDYEPAEMMLSKPSSIKKGCYAYQWLDSVDMHLYDQYIPCFSRVMTILLTDHGRTDCWTQIVIIVKTHGSCKINFRCFQYVSSLSRKRKKKCNILPESRENMH